MSFMSSNCKRFQDLLSTEKEFPTDLKSHISTCKSCENFLKTLKFVQNIEYSPRFTPRTQVWLKIKENIHFTPEPTYLLHFDRKKLHPLRITLPAIAVILIIFGVYIINVTNRLTITNLFEVKWTKAMSDTNFFEGANISYGQKIVINENSKMLLYKKFFGYLRLEGPCKLKFIDKNTIELESGQIIAITEPLKDNFTILNKHGNIKVVGTTFTVNARENMISVIVTKGHIKFYNSFGEKIVESASFSFATNTTAPAIPLNLENIATLESSENYTHPTRTLKLASIKTETENTLNFELNSTPTDDTALPILTDSSYTYFIFNIVSPTGKTFTVKSVPEKNSFKFALDKNLFIEQGEYKISACIISYPQDNKYWNGSMFSDMIIFINRR